ncbi:MAG: DUF6159 family protein [Candidatus Korarchaeota archaeon]
MSKTKTTPVSAKEKGPASKGGIFVFLLLFGVVAGLGIKGIIDLMPAVSSGDIANIVGPLVWAAMPTLITGLVIVATISILGAFLALKVGKDHGVGIVYAGNVLLLLVGLITVVAPFVLFRGTIPMDSIIYTALPGIVPLLISILNFTVFRDRLKRAGKFLSLSCHSVLDEKEVALVPLLSPFLYTVALVFLGFGLADLWYVLPNILVGEEWGYVILGATIFDIFAFLYLTVLFYYMSDAIIISIVYDWYRKRDPSFKTGFRAMLNVLGALALYAFYSTIIRLIQQALSSQARRGGAVSRVFYRSASEVVGTIWKYINYFTLPALVIDRKGAHHAIKRSVKLLFRYYGDVLVRESAVKYGIGILMLLFMVPYIVFGAVLGGILFNWDLIFVILMALAFVIIGSIFAYPVFHAISLSYITIMYGFVEDLESNFQMPSRVGGEIFHELKPFVVKAYEKEKLKDPNAPPPPSF